MGRGVAEDETNDQNEEDYSEVGGSMVKENDQNGGLSTSIIMEQKQKKQQQPQKPLSSCIYWKQGLAHKEYLNKPQAWSDLAMTLDGRDKITKVIQYSSRLLAWYLASYTTGNLQKQAARMALLKANLTISRKAFRMGRTGMELLKVYTSGLGKALLWQLKELVRMNSNGENELATPAWKTILTNLKTIGLAVFWAADNTIFLSYSGLFDDLRLPLSKRETQRAALQKRVSTVGNRFYFMGAVAAMVMNLKLYFQHRAETNAANNELLTEEDVNKAKKKEFDIFVALLKACCDSLVFSNNTGVDLWKQYTGSKLHEGIHCLAGLTSASTVILNKYPAMK